MKYGKISNYINGKNVASTSQRSLAINSPLDGNSLGEIPLSNYSDLDIAVKAAQALSS